MTAFTKTQLPDDINTLEKLALWVGIVMEYLYTTESYRESASAQALSRAFTLTGNDSEKKKGTLSRYFIHIDPALATQGKLPWNCALPIDTLPIPEWFSAEEPVT